MVERVTMLAVQEMVVLKLFSGPQVGGEAVLTTGEYILGRDVSCDIVIDDILVEAQHCRLIIDDDSVELESLDGPVYVEGKLFNRGNVELFDYIMIGGSCFALGTTKSQWPARPIPDVRRDPIPMSDSTTSESPIPAETDDERFKSTTSAAANGDLLSKPAEFHPTNDSHRMALAWLSLISVAVLIIALLIVAATRGFSEEVATKAEEAVPMEERLWEITRSQTFESDIRIENSNRGWTVIGYLDKRADRLRLYDDLRKVLPSASIKLWDSESLAESAQGVLTSLHLPLSAKPGKAGTVVVSGAIKDVDQWSSARERILRDISAIRNLEDQAITAISSKKANDSIRKIAEEPITPTPSVAATDTSPATAPETDIAAKTVEPPLTIRNVYLLPTDVEAPLRPNPSIRSVSVGAFQSLVTTEGTRVMKGGRLDGWMVMDIAKDKIVLERGKYRHIVDLLAP